MAPLSANRNTKMLGNDPRPTFIEKPVAANAHIYNGAIVGLDASGNAAPASVSTRKIIGRAEAEADNTGGAAGAITVRVRQGVFKFANSGTTDALTAADEGMHCFVADDQTVARTDANGTRSVAGVVIQVDADGVFVQLSFPDATSEQGDPTLLTLLAEDNFAAAQYAAVTIYNNAGAPKAKIAAAGDASIGIVQNAPKAGEIARVRVFGKSQAIASGGINPGVLVAAAANGQLKAASALAVAGAAANGSHIVGVALTLGSANNAFQILVRGGGAAVPTNGV